MIKDTTDLIRAIHHSIANRQTIIGQQCGCFFCLRVFSGDTVTDFVDSGKTAVCPWCGIDSILPGITETEQLDALNHYYFGSLYDE